MVPEAVLQREALGLAVPEALLLGHLLREGLGEGQGEGVVLLQALLQALPLAPAEAL